MNVTDLLPRHWTSLLVPGRPTALGQDQATSERGTSNPSCLVVMQRLSPAYAAKLVLRWKSASADVSEAILLRVLDDLIAHHTRPRACCIDASNEVFHAQRLRKAAMGKCPVYLIKSGEKVSFRGQDTLYKPLLGNMLAAAAEDNMLILPCEEWIIDDCRLVKRDRGSFMTETGAHGEHGDVFDALKLALWGLEGIGGTIDASAVSITASTAEDEERDPDLPGDYFGEFLTA